MLSSAPLHLLPCRAPRWGAGLTGVLPPNTRCRGGARGEVHCPVWASPTLAGTKQTLNDCQEKRGLQPQKRVKVAPAPPSLAKAVGWAFAESRAMSVS